MMWGRALATGVTVIALGLGMVACTPEQKLPPVPSAAAENTDPEMELFTISRDWTPNDRGVTVSAEQKAAFDTALSESPDIRYRMDTEGVNDTFVWNIAYVGATAPKKVLTDEVLKADLGGFYKDATGNTDLLGGIGDSEFMTYVSEETGIPETAMYFHVVAHIAQLGALHLR